MLLHDLYDEQSEATPQAPALVCFPSTLRRVEMSYEELRDRSLRLASGLLRELAPCRTGDLSKDAAAVGAAAVLAIHMPRSCPDFLPLLLAASRVGASFVLMSTDLREKDLEFSRNAAILDTLQPSLIVIDAVSEPGSAGMAAGSAAPRTISVQSLATSWHPQDATNSMSMNKESGDKLSTSPVCFLFTGGTTRTRCAVVTHAMLAHERRHYPECMAISAPAPRVLAQTSVYWGASALGQVSIALAYCGCAVFCEGRTPEDLRAAVASEQVDVLGTTPSELEGLAEDPSVEMPGLRGVFTWGEALPLHVAERWRGHPRAQLRELLISTECWLSLYGLPLDVSGRRGLRTVRGARALVLAENGRPAIEGEVGELLLSGPMVTSGYVPLATAGASAAGAQRPFHDADGQRYFRTRDLVRVTAGGLLEFRGRVDMGVKVHGKWVDLLAAEEALQALPGIAAVRVIPDQREMAQPHAFVVFAIGADIPLELEALRKMLPQDAHLHILDHLPRHPVTKKADLKRLRELAAPNPDGSWPLVLDGPAPAHVVARAKSMAWRQGAWMLAAVATAAAWDARALVGFLWRRRLRAGTSRNAATGAGFAMLPFMHLAFLHCSALPRMQWLDRGGSQFHFWSLLAGLVLARGVAAPGSALRNVSGSVVVAWAAVGAAWGLRRGRALSFPAVFWLGIGHRLQQDLSHRLQPSRLVHELRQLCCWPWQLLSWCYASFRGDPALPLEAETVAEERPLWDSAVCSSCGRSVWISLQRSERAVTDTTASHEEGDGAKDGQGRAHCWRCWTRVAARALDEAAGVALQLLAEEEGSTPVALPFKALGSAAAGPPMRTVPGTKAAPSEVPSPPVAQARLEGAREEPCEWRIQRTDHQDLVDVRMPRLPAARADATAAEGAKPSPELLRLRACVERVAGSGAGAGPGTTAPLQSLDSLRISRLTASLRLELGVPGLTTAAVRRAVTLPDILQAVHAARGQQPEERVRTEAGATHTGAWDRGREYAVHYSPGQHIPMGAWVVRSDSPIDATRLREAIRLLLERHGALRARPRDPLRMLSFCLDTGILFTLVARVLDRGPWPARLLRRYISRALRTAWPRMWVPPAGSQNQIPLESTVVGDQRALEQALRERRQALLKRGEFTDIFLARLRAQLAGLWVFLGGGGDIAVLPPPPSHRDSPLVYADRKRREAGLLVGPGHKHWVAPPYGFPAVLCARLAPKSAVVWLRLSRPGELVVLWKADDAPQTRWARHVAHLAPGARYAPSEFSFLAVQVFHSLADGHSYEPIVGDLLELYTGLETERDKVLRPSLPPLVGEAFGLLEGRLTAALDAVDPASFPQLLSLRGSLSTIKFRGRGYNHCIGLQRGTVDALQYSAARYGVPMDVMLLALTAIGIAWASKTETVHLTLYVPMRDGPGEAGLVGLFADWRLLTVRVDPLTATVLGVALGIQQALRLRKWAVFNALAKPESTMVNFQRMDTAPPATRSGFVQVGEELWRLGEQRQGLRVRRSDQLEPVLQPLSVTIEQQDEETWWVILTCAVRLYPTPWARRFVQGFEDALQALLLAPTRRLFPDAAA